MSILRLDDVPRHAVQALRSVVPVSLTFEWDLVYDPPASAIMASPAEPKQGDFVELRLPGQSIMRGGIMSVTRMASGAGWTLNIIVPDNQPGYELFRLMLMSGEQEIDVKLIEDPGDEDPAPEVIQTR